LRRQRAKGLHIAREPEGQESLEAFGTGEIDCTPDSAEGFKEKVGLVKMRASSFLELRLSEASKFLEYSDSMFAVKPTGRTELIGG
jgi:hypothetical protein